MRIHPLAGREEEGLLLSVIPRNENRAAQAVAPDVLFERRDREAEEVAGVQIIVAEVLEHAAVKGRAATLGLQQHDGRAHQAVFRAVVVLKNADLGEGIGIWSNRG